MVTDMLDKLTVASIQSTVAGEHLVSECLAQLEVPSLCYSSPRLKSNIDLLEALHRGDRRLEFAYAMKACSLRPVLEVVTGSTMSVEVQSRHESLLAIEVGISPSRLIWNSPRKSSDDLKFAVQNNIRVIVDSLSEGLNLLDLARAEPVGYYGVRLNLPLDQNYFVPANEKLGMSPDHLLSFLKSATDAACAPSILHAHVAARLDNVEILRTYIEALKAFMSRADSDLSFHFTALDLGGGWEARNRLERSGVSAQDLVNVAASGVFASPAGCNINTVIFEPGRFLVEDAGFALGRVIRRKILGNRQWLVLDISTNLLVPLPLARFEPAPASGDRMVLTSFCDGSCAPTVFARDCPYPITEEGTFVVLLNCGAYSAALASPFFEPPAPIIWCNSDGSSHILSSESSRLVTRTLQGFDGKT